jgi:hypothetical protein
MSLEKQYGTREVIFAKRVLADGMYDSNKNFRYLSKNHIKPAIKTRRNSKVKNGRNGILLYQENVW